MSRLRKEDRWSSSAPRAHGPEAVFLQGVPLTLQAVWEPAMSKQAFIRYPGFRNIRAFLGLSFADESESYRRLQELLPEWDRPIWIDSYDTVEGARKAAALGRPLWGVRLDSGDLANLSKQVRAILDDAGLQDAKIMATSDLNENRISELLADGAPIDSFGVGTELTTSYDAPAVSAVYKLVEMGTQDGKRYVAKYSAEKRTYPGSSRCSDIPSRMSSGTAVC